MDYYTRKQRERKQAILTEQRKQTAKEILTAIIALPFIWLFLVLFLSI
jgi:hypothetical protein